MVKPPSSKQDSLKGRTRQRWTNSPASHPRPSLPPLTLFILPFSAALFPPHQGKERIQTFTEREEEEEEEEDLGRSAMEDQPSPHGEEGLVKFNSCWGRLRGRLKRWCRLTKALRRRRPCCRARPGSFRYDPLSYSQNFDEGSWEMDEAENQCRGYMARFALPITKPAGQ